MRLGAHIRWKAFLFRLLCYTSLVFAASVESGHAQSRPETESSEKTILVLHAYEGNAPVFWETDKGLSDTLLSGGVSSLNLFFESLELRRHPSPEHLRLLVEQMRIHYGQRKLDMIITMYPEALRFVLDDARDILPGVPVLALYLPQNFKLPQVDRRIIGHAPTLDLAGTIKIAQKLVPGLTRVYVVSGTHAVDRGFEEELRNISKNWEGQLEFLYLSHLPFEQMLAVVAGVPPGSVILVLPLSEDISGASYTSRIVVQRLSQASAIPIFGVLTPALGHGIAGGSLVNFELIGRRSGQIVLDVLNETAAQEKIPQVLDVPPVPMFDWRRLRRWNLSESALPAGSVVINREFTLRDFEVYLLGILAFVLAQSGLIAGLLIARRRRRSAEDSLRQKTEELTQFFNVSLDLLAIANTDGYFLLLNPAWEKILGYRTEELMAHQILDFVHPDDVEATREALTRLTSQLCIIHFENRYRAKDGTYRCLEWSAAPAGRLVYAGARDITERLEAEAEDQQRREELAHVTRIAMMSELTTSLAHEINQPLTAILSNAQAAQRFLSQSPPNHDEIRQILQDIVRDNERASGVVRKVRALVKKEQPRYEALDLNELMQQVVDLLRGETLLGGLSIRTDFSSEPATVHGDAVQLQQVTLNLILNSAAASRDSPLPQRRIIVGTRIVGSRMVEASVTDFGVGIDEAHIERLFQPFYTTKPNGLGMGLPISRTIVKAHGGWMGARNNPKGGATFYFVLPTRLEVRP